jgi:hypothetical protein
MWVFPIAVRRLKQRSGNNLPLTLFQSPQQIHHFRNFKHLQKERTPKCESLLTLPKNLLPNAAAFF